MPWSFPRPGTATAMVAAIALFGVISAGAQTTPPDPSSAQPTVPKPMPGLSLNSPVPGEGTTSGATKHRHAVYHGPHRIRIARHRTFAQPIERPALAGVELLEQLPHPNQPPHLVVMAPAYPVENATAFFTTPPPPVMCHRVPRDPDAPDPRLLYEKSVICEADNP